MKKYVYLILSSSSSLPAKLIKRFTKNMINHSSISLDDSLHCMYSFGRQKMWNAFSGGFVIEHKDKGFYERFTDTYIELYRFPVDEQTYQKVQDCLTDYAQNKEELRYNYLGVALSKFDIPLERENRYFCSEFVASVFDQCQIRELNRNVHTYHPYYFLELDDKELIYKGPLAEYYQAKKEQPLILKEA